MIVTVLGGLAPLTHDLFGLSPFALAGLALLIGHPRRFRIASSLVMIGILYFVVATSIHSGVRQSHGIGWHSATSLLHYLATLLVPVSNVTILEVALRSAGAGPWSGSIAHGTVFLLGVAVLFVIPAWLWKSRSLLVLGIVGVGLGLMAPALVVDRGRQWVDARYAYPASAILIPVVVGSLDELRHRIRGGWVRPALRIGLILWYLAISSGTLSMVHQAILEGRDPKTLTRWERLERLLEQE